LLQAKSILGEKWQ